MKKYQAELQKHLARYAMRRLGVQEMGVYDGREYAHVLPYRQRYLNFLEGIRAELQDYLLAKPEIKLHRYFHHLNSSQAFALNLFFPYFSAGGANATALTMALGVQSDVADWAFEAVPDTSEGTNVDVAWQTGAGAKVYCEVKLSEAGFGTAKNDSRHQEKLAKKYVPSLKDLVSAKLLVPDLFFQNYQLLRNVALLAGRPDDRLLILLPRENDVLHPPLQKLLLGVNAEVRNRIGVAHVEVCLKSLSNDPGVAPRLRLHAEQMQEKYVIG